MPDKPNAFATVEQLESGWHPLLDGERSRAAVLLERATRMIKAQCPRWAQAENHNPGICADVCCAMVMRAMQTGDTDIPDGVKQMSQTTGVFSDSYTFDNPLGNLYLRDEERRVLHAGAGGRAFTISYEREAQ